MPICFALKIIITLKFDNNIYYDYFVKDFETQVQFYIAELERERGCTDQVLAVEKKTESTINKQNNMIDGFIRLIQAVKEMEDEKDSDNS